MFRGRRRFPLNATAAVALVVFIAACRGACSHRDAFNASWSSAPLAEGQYEVTRVESADLLELRRARRSGDGAAARRSVRVRLLGVAAGDDSANSPVASRARNWMQDRLSAGTCRLEFDKRRLDGEGAFLAYVFAGDSLLNEELVRAGLARAEAKPDDSSQIARRIARAETEAKAARRGVWAGDGQPNSR